MLEDTEAWRQAVLYNPTNVTLISCWSKSSSFIQMAEGLFLFFFFFLIEWNVKRQGKDGGDKQNDLLQKSGTRLELLRCVVVLRWGFATGTSRWKDFRCWFSIEFECVCIWRLEYSVLQEAEKFPHTRLHLQLNNVYCEWHFDPGDPMAWS